MWRHRSKSHFTVESPCCFSDGSQRSLFCPCWLLEGNSFGLMVLDFEKYRLESHLLQEDFSSFARSIAVTQDSRNRKNTESRLCHAWHVGRSFGQPDSLERFLTFAKSRRSRRSRKGGLVSKVLGRHQRQLSTDCRSCWPLRDEACKPIASVHLFLLPHRQRQLKQTCISNLRGHHADSFVCPAPESW